MAVCLILFHCKATRQWKHITRQFALTNFSLGADFVAFSRLSVLEFID